MKLSNAKDAFLLHYFSGKKRARKTLLAYEADLQQFCEFAGTSKSVSVITKQLVSQWLTHLRKKNYSSATLYRKMATLRVFCTYLVQNDQITESPFWRINRLTFANPTKQQPQTIPNRDLRKLLAQAHRNIKTAESTPNKKRSPRNLHDGPASDTYRSHRDLALIELFRTTGIRISEIHTTNISQISVRKGIVTIPIPKTGQPRHVQMLYDSSLSSLEQYLRLRKAIGTGTSQALFLNATGSRLSVQGVTNILNRLCKQASLRLITPTMFRNTMEKTLLDKGVDLRVVLIYLGKSSIAPGRNPQPITTEHVVRELKKVRR
jgi:integrase/recombinase XerD